MLNQELYQLYYGGTPQLLHGDLWCRTQRNVCVSIGSPHLSKRGLTQTFQLNAPAAKLSFNDIGKGYAAVEVFIRPKLQDSLQKRSDSFQDFNYKWSI